MVATCGLCGHHQRGESHRGDPADGRRVGRSGLLSYCWTARWPESHESAARVSAVPRSETSERRKLAGAQIFGRNRRPRGVGGATLGRRERIGADEALRREPPTSYLAEEDEREPKMIPDTEAVCQASEVAVDSGDVREKIKDRPEKEAVTAWKRYQRLVAMMESRGSEFNRKSAIEAFFRGSDLVYASH